MVDECIVVFVLKNLLDEEVVVLLLILLIVYELLFEKFGLILEENVNCGKKILVINGVGGVGLILN